jgi:hypothetical protein
MSNILYPLFICLQYLQGRLQYYYSGFGYLSLLIYNHLFQINSEVADTSVRKDYLLLLDLVC